MPAHRPTELVPSLSDPAGCLPTACSQDFENPAVVLQARQGGAMSQPWETPCQSSHANTLAVLLTHISHSYISLVQIVAKNDTLHAPPEPALLPASPSYHMPSCSSQPAHMRTAENQSEPASESANHQHVSSKDQGYPGVSHTADVAIPVELCPFQQELAERIMQAKNTVMFLPAGVLYERKAYLSMITATPTFQPVTALHA